LSAPSWLTVEDQSVLIGEIRRMQRLKRLVSAVAGPKFGSDQQTPAKSFWEVASRDQARRAFREAAFVLTPMVLAAFYPATIAIDNISTMHIIEV
jgi:hypothetical protein